jgi:sugar phosphate isomerase/epimerase
MFKALGPGAIGIQSLSLVSVVAVASKTGFTGVEINIREVASLVESQGLNYVRELFEDYDVRPSHWGLPVAWRDEQRWQDDLETLPALAECARQLNCLRTATWCPPASDERPFKENFTWHKARFGAIAAVLADYDCKLGIEFIGPQTLRDGHPYPFIYTLEGMMELAVAIGTGNVGLLLDVWHLYTSGGSAEDISAITADNVVLVHVNDAPAGIAREAHIDSKRCLPMETGVIQAPAMLRVLDALGYDGPVMAEPFSQSLNELGQKKPLSAAARTMHSLEQLWAASGLD